MPGLGLSTLGPLAVIGLECLDEEERRLTASLDLLSPGVLCSGPFSRSASTPRRRSVSVGLLASITLLERQLASGLSTMEVLFVLSP